MRPETFERSAAWLSGLFEDDATRDPWAAMYGLAGLGLCSAAGPVLKNAAAHCADLLAHVDLTPYDPTLVRLTHITLTTLGFPSPGPPAAAPPPPEWPSDADPYDLLTKGPDELRDCCDAISAVTGFGSDPLQVPAAFREPAAALVLPALAIRALRCADLELGALLLRTTGYLDHPIPAEPVGFLAARQWPDGRFGDFHAIAGRTGVPELRLYLPVTVGCLWTLAEACTPGYRLMEG
ncbi:hypothetical protein AGRA3207_003480 [Actinomadura graeca]|uniref:Uncharacterized protein n=1 Tax=Actinomadura graeca TaxID=2750812 RepID=A0ABX8QXM7_9ACTN|nr:hypothetical protein [Actinomadura graeca]QXJ22477.1 hypothetical protein AGRA3207_003480 [Actinomadura graeca]